MPPSNNNPPDNKTTPPGPPPPNAGKDDSLGQLRHELYAREESKNLTDREDELHHLGIRRQTLPAATGNTRTSATIFENITTKRARRHKRILIGVGIAVIMAILFGAAVWGTLWYRVRKNVQPNQINLTLQAPTEFTAGELITYSATLRNNSFVNWEKVELVFEPPKGFRYKDSSQELTQRGKQYILAIGTLPSKGTKDVSISGQLLGEYNASLAAKMEVFFTPENFPSGQFTSSALATTRITLVPVEVSLDGKDEAQSGERILLTIYVRNSSANSLNNTFVKLNPAPGLQLAPDDDQFSRGFSVVDSRWDIGTIEPLGTAQRVVIMYSEGKPSERRTLDVEVGIKDGDDEFIQRNQSHLITITSSALTVDQTYNDAGGASIVTPGQKVTGVIRYSNIGTTDLKNAIIKVAFEGVGLDPASLQLPAGAYDPSTRTVTWTSASVPDLAILHPHEEKSVSYGFLILPPEEFPTTGENIKNNVVVATATVDSPDIITPTGQQRNLVSDRNVLSVATTATLDTGAFYDDGRLGIVSDGPLPPRVGEQTTYTIRFRIGSTLNDLGDVRLTAVLPDGVSFTDKVYKTTGEITFNDRSGELIWTIPKVDGFTGRTKPPEELHFQVAIRPGENQQRQTITLLKSGSAEGTDLFTDNRITAELKSLPTTETAAKDKGQVE